MELEYGQGGKGMKLELLGNLGFLKMITFKRTGAKSSQIDFAYKLLTSNPQPRYQVISPSGQILIDVPKAILESNLDQLPTLKRRYGFWGTTQQRFCGGLLAVVPKLETGLKYTKDRNNLHVFTTKIPYRSYNTYKGCSGAPILDSEGQLVSQVVRGDSKKVSVLGVSYEKLRGALDAEILQHET